MFNFNERRGAINAAITILDQGGERFLNDGIRFGFFEENDTIEDVLERVIAYLEKNGEYELACKLNLKLTRRVHYIPGKKSDGTLGYFKVIEGSDLHKKILEDFGKMPTSIDILT
jgi:hypothetical protein